jgi:hypothetical protein
MLGHQPYSETEAAKRAFTAVRMPDTEDDLWLDEHDQKGPVFGAYVLAALRPRWGGC